MNRTFHVNLGTRNIQGSVPSFRELSILTPFTYEKTREMAMKHCARILGALRVGTALAVGLLFFAACGGPQPESGNAKRADRLSGTWPYTSRASCPEAPFTKCWRRGQSRGGIRAGYGIRVVEAGNNQAEWLDKLTALAASGNST
jgi:hypothetical protein